jgi:CHAT domain-containing protein
MNEGPASTYVHIASHNQFDEQDPLSSALRMSDGDLSARDIFTMRLSADMVVLSACQSGVSRRLAGDELMGIVRALLFAGAPSIVVSLWNAYDAPTTELMVKFYANRVHERQAKATALCNAQREKYKTGSRLWEWAPFILIGNWR